MAVFALVLVHFIMNISSNVCFKKSALSKSPGKFVLWQIPANLMGFACVLTFTVLLRHLSMSVAFPLTQGLGVLGIQFVAARPFFKERIPPLHWVGTGLIVSGIILLFSA